MNSASQNFPHHLGALRQRMLHPTDYELAVNYFLEEFAGDMAFVRGSEPEQMPHLVAVLNIVVSKVMGRHVESRMRSCRICENRRSCMATRRRMGALCCSSTLRMQIRGCSC